MLADAADAGGRIDGAYYCRHGWEEGCDCRKPLPGLLFQAQREHRSRPDRGRRSSATTTATAQAADARRVPRSSRSTDDRSLARHRRHRHRGGYSVTMTTAAARSRHRPRRATSARSWPRSWPRPATMSSASTPATSASATLDRPRSLDPDDRQGHPRSRPPRTSAGFDAVVHLAALSNDPIGNLNDGWTAEINDQGSVRLAELAQGGRRRGASCSPLPASCTACRSPAWSTEESPLDPQTEYARSKVAASARSPSWPPTGSRRRSCATEPSTACRRGCASTPSSTTSSGAAVTTRQGRRSTATASRGGPSCTCRTSSRAFSGGPRSAARGRSTTRRSTPAPRSSTTRSSSSPRSRSRTVPGAELEVLAQPGRRPADLQDRLRQVRPDVPGLPVRLDADEGRSRGLRRVQGDRPDRQRLRGDRFTRLKWLRHLLDSGRLDGNLRWVEQPEAVAR